ncbi:MAG: hypothetical protein JXB29_13130 [Sedimentisphaerales bacterium]|nr:hypothetical protein [Sedimentisphaerales bacterium]
MYFIQWIFLPILQTFVWHPERILGVSLLFLLGFFGMRLLGRKYPLFGNKLLLISGISWALFALWEFYCEAKQYNIRVDLLLIYPVLMSISIFSVLAGISNLLLSFHRRKDK